MKTIIFSITLFVLYVSANAQVTFQKTYDIGFGDFIGRVIQCSDNGYLMAGTDMSIPPVDCYLIKTDTAGVVQWSKYYGDGELLSLFGMYYVNDVKQTSDGGFIMTGNCNSSPAFSSAYDDLFLIKLDASGNIQWSQAYGGSDTEYGTCVIQTSDGGYLAVGYTYSFGTKDSSNIYMVKTNSSGTMQWDRAFQISPNDDDVANSVAEHSAGYILTGYTEQVFAGVDTTTDIVIIGTDLNGNNPFVYTYGTDSEDESGNSIGLINPTSLVITGSTSESATGLDDLDAYIMQINTSGAITWCSGYDVGFADEGQYLKPQAGGGFTVVGFTIASLFPLNLKSFLLNVNSSGNVMWARRYGTNMSFNIFSSGQQTHDNGFIIGTMGTTGYDYYLIKTDPNGYSKCNEEDVSGTKRAYYPAQETPSYTQYSGGSGHSIVVATGDVTPTETTLCIEVPCDTPVVVVNPPAATICEGESITLTASGADTYSWNTGESTASITVSPTTTTTYTVTGMTGGICPSYPVDVTVTVNPAPSVTISGNNTICDGESTTLTAAGGTSYLWSNTSTNPSITVNPTTTTTYYVTVTGSNGCTTVDNETVTVNPLPTASISGNLNICEGNSTTLTANGGSSYLWSTTETTQAIIVSPVTTTAYTVTVTDGNGCTDTETATVNVTPVPTITIVGDTAICEGESATISASGGDTYLWSNNSTNDTIVVSPASTTTYTVTVTISATGCTNTLSHTLTVNTIPVISFSGNTSICEGDSTLITASGGTSYQWETGSNTADELLSPVNSDYFTVTVTNGSTSCSNIDSVYVTVNPLPVISFAGDDTICYGETTTITASGGDSYLWSTTDNTASVNLSPASTSYYTVTVTDAVTSCSNVDSIEIFVDPLPVIVFTGDTSLCIGDSTVLTASGGDTYVWSTGSMYDTTMVQPASNTDYYVTVTNSITGCVNNDTVTVYVHELPIAVAGPDTTVCEGIPVTLNAGGGVTYNWSPSTGLDNPSAQNPVATPSATTTYIVTVANAFSCTDTASVTITINPAPDVMLGADNAECNGNSDGSAWVSSVSGYAPFTYLWSNASTDTIITGLSAGTYTVTVTDAIGCSTVESIQVTEPTSMKDSLSIVHVSCFGGSNGSIALNMSGGTPPYQYNWDSGHNTGTITGLSAGSYSVTVTDQNNCVFMATEIDVLQPDSLLITESINDVSCYGYTNGSATLTVSGGTPPYSYSWSNGDTLPYLFQVSSGLYYYSITDNNNCTEIGSVLVSEPTPIVVVDSIINASCLESNDGQICIEVYGSSQSLEYYWLVHDTVINECLNNITAGEYTVVVHDYINNCRDTLTYTVGSGPETCLLIPTLFTPNGDGYNDEWTIRGIEYYPNCKVEVYNRWGDKIYSDSGSIKAWDGTYNGRNMPMGSYIFIIDLGDGREPIQGIVSIKR